MNEIIPSPNANKKTRKAKFDGGLIAMTAGLALRVRSMLNASRHSKS